MSSYRECRWCCTRVLLIKGVPALNWTPDPTGKVAVTIPDPRTGRFLAKDEEPARLEKRYAVHDCAGTRAARRPRSTRQQGGAQIIAFPGMRRRKTS